MVRPAPRARKSSAAAIARSARPELIFNPDSTEALIFSVSVKSPGAESWLVAASNETAFDRFFVTTAICANVNS